METSRHGDSVAASDDARVARMVMDAVPALVGYWDANLRNVAANASYREYFGFDPGTLAGRHIREVLGEELYLQNEPYLLAALDGEEQLFDRAITDTTGVTRYTQASYVPDVVDGVVCGVAVLVTDVTARRTAERTAVDAESRFRALFDMAPIGTFLVGMDGRVVHANAAAADVLGYDPEELIGMALADIHGPDDPYADHEVIRRLQRGEGAQTVERQYRRADGSLIWAQLDARLLPADGHGEQFVLGQLQDVTRRRADTDHLARLAFQDPLTGLLNRRGFIASLADVTNGAVVLFDLDRFKLVNDELGHRVGDEVLVAVARLFETSVDTTASVARLGGDEFAVLLPGASPSTACDAASSLRSALQRAALGLPRSPVGASVGVGMLAPGIDPADALAQADLAMYDEKRQGSRARKRARPRSMPVESRRAA